MKALVVDDSKMIRVILSRVLSEVGFTDVAQAQHGKEGYDYLLGHPDTNLVLVDWNMPEMNGIDMVKAVRREECLGGVKIMMVTTESEIAHMQQAIDSGANEFVMKPFTKDVIVDKLHLLGF